MGGSEFDELFDEADDELFETFGERGGALYDPGYGCQPKQVGAVLQRSAGGIGGVLLAPVEYAVDLRIREVPEPHNGDLIILGGKRYVLDEHMGTDSLINRFSLMPAD